MDGINSNGGGEEEQNENVQNVLHVNGMYKNWFLDYASYVILERAVPALEDGLKPVQRRIMHSLEELEDGRYNKVANVIGHCMKYHPHGDASIGDAMVALGQKDLLIDCQGNWGNVLTGDSAAAARYIEARLSKFAIDVVFNPKTTKWQTSYDGRNKEPINLPIKFPLLLAQGVEGIAVGLACKMMPHNFIELIDASIDVLRGRKVNIMPDFVTGGMADFSNYNEGLRGGKIRVRAKISIDNAKTLKISEIPFSTTTTSLIDSIVAANDKEKIKVRKVEDNTSENVEILVHLHPGISPDKTIDALYAFTDCEISISPNSCVIENDKPKFLSVNEMLKISTQQTLGLLKRELEIRMAELMESYFFSSLEKIFIKEEMYIEFKNYSTKETLFEYLDKRFEKHKKQFYRKIVNEDFDKLTQIPMIRITRFDSAKADEKMRNIEEQRKEVQANLDNLVNYAVEYFKELKKKYGKGRERKTEIKNFGNIVASAVAVASEKLYVNLEEGFAGYSLKKDTYVADCSTLDEMIIFRQDGTMTIMKVADKVFIGKGVLHIAIFKKGDDRTTYNMVYQDGPKGISYMKRFPVSGTTRDKVYDLTKGSKDSKVLYFTANPNGESEVVTVVLKPHPSLRKTEFDLDFGQVAIKARNTMGNIVTKMPVKKIVQKSKGLSSLGARMLWFDDTVQRLNIDGHGQYLGEFTAEDQILSITQSGHYRITGFDISTHFDDDTILLEKFNPDKIITAVYFEGEKKEYFVKRFKIENTSNKTLFITETPGSRIELVASHKEPIIELIFPKVKGEEQPNQQIKLAEFIDVKGWKAKGNKLSTFRIKEINLLPPPPEEMEQLPSTETGGDDKPADDRKSQILNIADKLKQTELFDFDDDE